MFIELFHDYGTFPCLWSFSMVIKFLLAFQTFPSLHNFCVHFNLFNVQGTFKWVWVFHGCGTFSSLWKFTMTLNNFEVSRTFSCVWDFSMPTEHFHACETFLFPWNCSKLREFLMSIEFFHGDGNLPCLRNLLMSIAISYAYGMFWSLINFSLLMERFILVQYFDFISFSIEFQCYLIFSKLMELFQA